jgi:uncharacterized protein
MLFMLRYVVKSRRCPVPTRKVRRIDQSGLDCVLACLQRSHYPVAMFNEPPALTPDELRRRLHPFCERHHIRRLEVFGSAAHGQAGPSSDVDLLVTFDDSVPVSSADLLEMAGEAEELVGRPVDFVLRPFLEKSPNRHELLTPPLNTVSILGSLRLLLAHLLPI